MRGKNIFQYSFFDTIQYIYIYIHNTHTHFYDFAFQGLRLYSCEALFFCISDALLVLLACTLPDCTTKTDLLLAELCHRFEADVLVTEFCFLFFGRC